MITLTDGCVIPLITVIKFQKDQIQEHRNGKDLVLKFFDIGDIHKLMVIHCATRTCNVI